GRYELETSIPIALHFEGVVGSSEPGDNLPPGVAHGVKFRIVCGTTPTTIVASRVPSMHAFGEDHLTFNFSPQQFSTLMNPDWYAGPDAVVAGKVAMTGDWAGHPHGTPFESPSLTLHVARRASC